MGLFEVIIAPKALEQLDKYVEYIRFTLLNDDAANRVWADAVDTIDEMETVAGSLQLSRHPALKKLGYRVKMFKSHDYVMIYRIEDNIVYVEGIYHMLQDYANLFVCEQLDGEK